MKSSKETLSRSTKSAFPNSKLSSSAMLPPQWSSRGKELNSLFWSADKRWALAGFSELLLCSVYSCVLHARFRSGKSQAVNSLILNQNRKVFENPVRLLIVNNAKRVFFLINPACVPQIVKYPRLFSSLDWMLPRYTVPQLRTFSWSLSAVVRTDRPPMGWERLPTGHAHCPWRGVGQTGSVSNLKSITNISEDRYGFPFIFQRWRGNP